MPRAEAADKLSLLRGLVIGSRVAEDEVDELARYFVETEQWQRIFAGNVDIVFGPKGSGKSAIYTLLIARELELLERSILLVAGENLRGAAAFTDLVADPPTSQAEFVGIWKLYILSLLDGLLQDENIETEGALRLRGFLADAGIARGPGGLRGLIKRVREYLGALGPPESLETGLKFDAMGNPGLIAKITLYEPGAAARRAGSVSVDELIELASNELQSVGDIAWIVFDRLDVAFADSQELEANALRALFTVYLDLLANDAIRLKIFLRTDIWKAITAGGFREASHITRTATVKWDSPSLLNLAVRRLLQSEALVEYSAADVDQILGDSDAQRAFFDSLVPDQVDSGRNPKTFEWMIGRVADSSREAAPRELIHLLDQVREIQVKMLERGEDGPENGQIFSRQAFREALPEVSRVRLEQTLYAEYPALKIYLEALRGAKTEQNTETLAAIWRVPTERAAGVAGELVDVGFFERRGSSDDPDYWVPFLYRAALEMVQGSAE